MTMPIPIPMPVPVSIPPVRERVVVVGNGMAGSRFVEDLRRADPGGRFEVTLIGAESGHAYNRILLSNVLAGTARSDDIRIASEDWAERLGITVRTGARVISIDRERREVGTSDGCRTGYDRLVLATGSRAFVPPIAGLGSESGELGAGVAVFRTLSDCDEILRLARSSRRAVVLGGGLLGLEAARGLAERGLAVTVLHAAEHLMERQLDADASRILRRTLRTLGVTVRTDVTTTAVCRGPDGRITAVRSADGRTFDADLLVISCGVRPEVDIARAAGLAIGRAVIVDDQLRSVSDERIFAIGECCEHDGQVYGLLAPAWEQAAIVANVLTGSESGGRYRGSRLVTRLKAAGVELAAMGEVHHEQDFDPDEEDAESNSDVDPGRGHRAPSGRVSESASPGSSATSSPNCEVIRFADPTRGTYQKLVVRDDRLIGAILIGDTRSVGTLTQLFDRNAVIPADRATLILGSRGSSAGVESPVRIPNRATICQCNGVTKGAICQAFLDGRRSVAEIAETTRATTGCGTCQDTVTAIVDWLKATDPEPAAG